MLQHSTSRPLFMYFNALVGGLLASACCLVQLTLSFLGIGCVGLVKALTPVRPYLTAISLIFATYMHLTCKTCHVSTVTKWCSLAILVALILSPLAVDIALHRSNLTEGSKLQVKVSGMGCASCALSVKLGLESIPGLSSCQTTEVFDVFECSGQASEEAVKSAIEAKGFELVSVSAIR